MAKIVSLSDLRSEAVASVAPIEAVGGGSMRSGALVEAARFACAFMEVSGNYFLAEQQKGETSQAQIVFRKGALDGVDPLAVVEVEAEEWRISTPIRSLQAQASPIQARGLQYVGLVRLGEQT